MNVLCAGPLEGLQASVDYYTIEIEDTIVSIEADVLVERCFDRRFNPELSNDNFYCMFLERLPGQNTITNALEHSTNVSAFEVEGVDLQLDYTMEAGPGQLRAKWISTYLIGLKDATVQGEEMTENTGTASSGFDALPEWKWTTSLGYTWAGLDGDLRWRHIDETEHFAFPSFKLDAVDYLDPTFGYTFSDALDGLQLRAGVTNLTDEDPIIYPSNQQSNTDPSTYDILGRRFFVSATYTIE